MGSLGKDAIRLVSSKRRGRIVDPVYISVELRLSSLIKLESIKATRLQRWYRNLIDMRVWLPQLQKKAQDRKERRASTRIQTFFRTKLAQKKVNGPNGKRITYTKAAEKMQRVGREYLVRTKEKNVRLAREKKVKEQKEIADQKKLEKEKRAAAKKKRNKRKRKKMVMVLKQPKLE